MAFIMPFIGGVQMVSLGIVGEFIARIYHEVKQRPAHVIARVYQRSDEGQTRTITRDEAGSRDACRASFKQKSSRSRSGKVNESGSVSVHALHVTVRE